MRKTTVVLLIASLGLAACAGYLAYELKNAHDALANHAATTPPSPEREYGAQHGAGQ
jgi:Flp pilus assembly protein CpaB